MRALVGVWRGHRGLSARALASRAGISGAYLSQIETGRKPGSFDAMAKLARALGVDMEDLEPWQNVTWPISRMRPRLLRLGVCGDDVAV